MLAVVERTSYRHELEKVTGGMARKEKPVLADRRADGENMFVSDDQKSLSRGRRVVSRTEVCRPCLVWTLESPDEKKQGVMLDLTPYGMRIRMLEGLAEGSALIVQMMRDDEFRMPLANPIRAQVLRAYSTPEGFVDHGLQVKRTRIKRPDEFKRIDIAQPHPSVRSASRMYSMDYTVTDRGVRRTGRGRG